MSPTWRIYYGDGSTFSDEEGSPRKAPRRNVQAIVQRDPDVGRRVLHGADYYWYDATLGCWLMGDLFGLWDYLTLAEITIVAFGRSVQGAEYKRAVKAATDDPDFLPLAKSPDAT